MRLVIAHTWDGAPVGANERVEVDLDLRSRELWLEVRAPFHGDPAPPQVAGSCPGLWNHEAVECFLVGEGGEYLEVELGPHGHYLLIALRGPRDAVAQGMPAHYDVERAGERWVGRLRLDRGLLPARVARANAFALHGVGSARRYLCWQPLPGPRPDFHQPERFPLVPELA